MNTNLGSKVSNAGADATGQLSAAEWDAFCGVLNSKTLLTHVPDVTGLQAVDRTGLNADIMTVHVNGVGTFKWLSSGTATAPASYNALGGGIWQLVTHNADSIVDGLTNKAYSATEKAKLGGVANGATANSNDTFLLDRSNHTGTQTADTIIDGTNNKAYTAAEKAKLGGVANGATANSADSVLLNRANHTGNQSADTLIDGSTNKAYTAAEKTKLGGVANGATANSPDATLLNRANHTGTQAASTIIQDANNRMVTDTQISVFNSGAPLAINQTGHGFAKGYVLTKSGSAYVKSQATEAGNLAESDGVVISVVDANNFVLGKGKDHFDCTGIIDANGQAMVANNYYYVVTTASGINVTRTRPTGIGSIVKEAFRTISTTEAVVQNTPAYKIISGASGGSGIEVTLDQFNPHGDGTDDRAAFQAANDFIVANGGAGRVLVRATPTGYGLLNTDGHGIYLSSNVEFIPLGQVKITLLGGGCCFTILSNISGKAVSLNDTVNTQRVIPVNSTRFFSVGQEVLVRFGVAVYDVPNFQEPDHFMYARIVARTNYPSTVIFPVTCSNKEANVTIEYSSDDEVFGQNAGSIAVGRWIEFIVNVASTGAYTLNFRVSSQETGGQITVQDAGSTVGTVTVPNTGDWQNYVTQSLALTLSAGSHTIRLLNTSSGAAHWNLNWWEYILTSAIPSSYSITLDKPCGYNLTVVSNDPNGIPIKTRAKSICCFQELRQNIKIGRFYFYNPATGGADAQSAVEIFYAKNVEIENFKATNPGTGMVTAQYCEGLHMKRPYMDGCLAQGGIPSKGRFLSIAECRDVIIDNPYLAGYEADGAIVFEGKNYNIIINNLHANNSFVDGSGNVASKKLIVNLGSNEIVVNNLYLEGNDHNVFDKSYDRGNLLLYGVTTIADGCKAFIDEGFGVTNFGVIRRHEQGFVYNYVKVRRSFAIAWPVPKSRSIYGATSKQGSWNATTNSPTLPTAASGNAGQFYVVGTAGTFNTVAYSVGDLVASDGTQWFRIALADTTLEVVKQLPQGIYTKAWFYSSTNTGAVSCYLGSSAGLSTDLISLITGGNTGNVGKTCRIGAGVFNYGSPGAITPQSVNSVDDKLLAIKGNYDMPFGQVMRLDVELYMLETPVYGAGGDSALHQHMNLLNMGDNVVFQEGFNAGTIRALMDIIYKPLPIFNDNAAAIAGNMEKGRFFRLTAGGLEQVH